MTHKLCGPARGCSPSGRPGPRWLWPTPPRTGNAPLPAHARPHLIRARARLATSGEWDAILELLLRPHVSPPPSIMAPQQPDLLTPANAGGLLLAGTQHRLSMFWRRLHSYGLLPPCLATTALVLSKWSQQPQTPPPADAPLLSQSEVAELFPLEDFDRAIGRLHFGTAPDSLGWHAVSFAGLSKDSEQPLVTF